MKLHRYFDSRLLWWEFQIYAREKSPGYRAGFLDATGVYVMTTLEGGLVDLYRWELLKALEGGWVNKKD